MANELLARLDTEADSVKEGSYQHSLCVDASECIRSLRKLVAGGDIGRKVMTADIDNSKRLANDHADALLRATGELDNRQREVEILVRKMSDHNDVYQLFTDEIEKLEGEKECLSKSNAELTALLTKKGG